MDLKEHSSRKADIEGNRQKRMSDWVKCAMKEKKVGVGSHLIEDVQGKTCQQR